MIGLIFVNFLILYAYTGSLPTTQYVSEHFAVFDLKTVEKRIKFPFPPEINLNKWEKLSSIHKSTKWIISTSILSKRMRFVLTSTASLVNFMCRRRVLKHLQKSSLLFVWFFHRKVMTMVRLQKMWLFQKCTTLHVQGTHAHLTFNSRLSARSTKKTTRSGSRTGPCSPSSRLLVRHLIDWINQSKLSRLLRRLHHERVPVLLGAQVPLHDVALSPNDARCRAGFRVSLSIDFDWLILIDLQTRRRAAHEQRWQLAWRQVRVENYENVQKKNPKKKPEKIVLQNTSHRNFQRACVSRWLS